MSTPKSLPSTSPIFTASSPARSLAAPRQATIVAPAEPDILDSNELSAAEKEETSIAVVAVKSLIKTIQTSKATTMMGLQRDLKDATDRLEKASSSLALTSGCELFMRFVTRTSDEITDFEKCKQRVLSRGEKFLQIAAQCRHKISVLADRFLRDGAVVLTHGYSRVVMAVLLHAAAKHKRFRVVVSEARPDNAGYKTIRRLSDAGVPCQLIMDAGVAFAMEQVDLVLVGAEAVVENGGIMNKTGTYQLSIVARAFNRPFYVAAESFKFTRLYPLSQRDPSLDLARARAQDEQVRQAQIEALLKKENLPASVKIENPSVDYTPPAYISLLFTDLGVLTPSAVSDELIKLYY